MFKNLFNFAYKRSLVEAVGFYLAHLILIILIGGLLAALLAFPLGRIDDFNFGLKVGTAFATLYILVISALVIKNKGLLGDFDYVVMIFISGVLAFLGGGLLGLIPIAFLTTESPKNR